MPMRLISRKLLHTLNMLKTVSLLVISATSCLSSNEIDRSLFHSDLKCTAKINLALDLAMKKYDGQKIWVIYTVGCTNKIGDRQIESVWNKDVMTLEQIIWGESYAQSYDLRENEKLKKKPLVYPENFHQAPTNDEILLHSNNQEQLNHSNLAIILDYSLESGTPCLYHIYFQTMNRPFPKDERPIIWLGREIPVYSFEWMVLQFHKTKYPQLKQELISAIGIQDCTERIVEFMKQIVLNNYDASLKEEAIYWLGQHSSIENIRFLAFLAIKHTNIQIRKKAIFALSQIKDDKAQSIVSTLARKEKNQEVRQEAIFWLSQIADEEALKTLNEILTEDKNAGMKAYTVFAISQLPASKSTPILHRIAHYNPDVQVRNKAKFWLDRTKNKRMMDFFMELVDEENRRGSN